MSTETIVLLAPEIILILFATAIYVGGAFTPAREGWNWLSAAGLLLAAYALARQQSSEPLLSAVFDPAASGLVSGPLLVDLFSLGLRWLILATALLLVMTSSRTAAASQPAEYMGSLLLIAAGLMLVSLAGDLVLMFVGLELVSIPTYVVLYLGRRGAAAQEATIKYFFLSILSSALLLYGFSFLYGVAGSTRLDALYRTLAATSSEAPGLAALAKLGMVLVFAGLGFRITLVPFHFYAPDVYQGTSAPNAALLAVVPKIAGLAALVRIVAVSMVGSEKYLQELATVGWHMSLALAVLTMTLGNLLALWQQNIRRLLAYSSIAHAGYMLIGLSVSFAVASGARGTGAFDGVGAMMFYLLVYAVATLGAFSVIAFLSRAGQPIDNVDELAGLARSHPWTSAAMALFMFSLTGLPPLAGFWGKFTLFMGAMGVDSLSVEPGGGLSGWFQALALAGALNAAIAAAYYLRVVATMFFRPSLATPLAAGGWGAGCAAAVCALLVLGIGLQPGALVTRANLASRAARMSIERPQPPSSIAATKAQLESHAEQPDRPASAARRQDSSSSAHRHTVRRPNFGPSGAREIHTPAIPAASRAAI